MQQLLAQNELPHYMALIQEMGTFKNGKFHYFNVAYLPYLTSQAKCDLYKNLQAAWHRVLLKVSQDHKFLIDVLEGLTGENQLLRRNLNILKKMEGRTLKDGICVDRIDYFQDLQGQPKITEYNLMCVGFQANNQKFQRFKQLQENDKTYLDNFVVANCTDSICELLKLKKSEGIVLFVIYTAFNLIKFDWQYFEAEFTKRSIKIVTTNMKEMAEKLSLRENGDLYFGDEKVAVVYNRTTFRLSDYIFGEEYDPQRSWEAKLMVCKSNALSIPPIEFELVNSKRVQTELAKPQVLRRYASQEDADLIMTTRVGEWEFDSMSQENLSALTAKVQADPSAYVLKPNLEGGGNNLYGEDILSKLRGDRHALRSYILMQKIKTKSSSNIFTNNGKILALDCTYEVSRYGTLTWMNGEIIRNQVDGFMIRGKPATANEGTVLSGVGAIVSCKIDR